MGRWSLIMKIISTIILVFLFVWTSNAQERSNYLIKYNFRFMLDSTDKNSFIDQNMGLWIGNSLTSYYDYDKFLQDSMMNDQISKSAFTGTISVGAPGMKNYSSTKYIKKLNDGKLTIYDRIIDAYKMTDQLESINWKIETETKLINGYKCQRATGKFRGRLYTAWFTTVLKTSAGPWKLHGLPGVILESYDQKGEVLFNCIEVVKYQTSAPFSTPPNAISVSIPEFKKLIRAFIENPSAFSSATGSGNIGGGTFISKSGNDLLKSNTKFTTPTKKNSIEL